MNQGKARHEGHGRRLLLLVPTSAASPSIDQFHFYLSKHDHHQDEEEQLSVDLAQMILRLEIRSYMSHSMFEIRHSPLPAHVNIPYSDSSMIPTETVSTHS